MEKRGLKIVQIKKKLIISEHALKNIYPLTKHKRIILSVFENIKNSIEEMLRLNPQINLSPENKKTILEVFRISSFQKECSMEFKRENKIVILSKNLETEILTEKKVHEFLKLSKKIFFMTTAIYDKYKYY